MIKKQALKRLSANRRVMIGMAFEHWSDRDIDEGGPSCVASYRDDTAPSLMIEGARLLPFRWKVSIKAKYADGTTDSTDLIIKNSIILMNLDAHIEPFKNELIAGRDQFPVAIGWRAVIVG